MLVTANLFVRLGLDIDPALQIEMSFLKGFDYSLIWNYVVAKTFFYSIIMATFATRFADMAKLADAPDLGSGAARHVGSTPIIRTINT